MVRLAFLIVGFVFFTSTKSLAEEVVTYALVADRIIDGRSNEAIEQQAIIVHNLIKDIISVNQLPTNIEVVRLMGGTLIPGMTNAHEHPLLYKHD
jgi:imidazolonepropionase-like amidohydrolase